MKKILKKVENLDRIINDSEKLDAIRQKGIEFAQHTSWDVEGKKVLDAVLKGIKEDEESFNNRG